VRGISYNLFLDDSSNKLKSTITIALARRSKMIGRCFGIFIVITVFFCNPARATVIDLVSWALQIDGALYDSFLGDPFPSEVDAGGFDPTSGLGTLEVSISGSGAHSVAVFLDHEIDEGTNTFFNEIGAASGPEAFGQSWEIDEPGYTNGDIFTNFRNNTLDNDIGRSVFGDTLFPDDVSMAMGWDFILAVNTTGQITFSLSEIMPDAGFFLTHNDPDSGASIYFTSSLNTFQDIEPIPEPATMVLMGTGLVVLAGIRKRRKR